MPTFCEARVPRGDVSISEALTLLHAIVRAEVDARFDWLECGATRESMENCLRLNLTGAGKSAMASMCRGCIFGEVGKKETT